MRHILIGILGFQTGGGEIFPIHLANALHDQGHNVSVLTLESEGQNAEIRALLKPQIPVYERLSVEAMGSSEFFESHNFDVIHTHYQGVDRWISQACRGNSVPYVVTLHGSHEVAELDDGFTRDLASTVDHWVYTADKNLRIFDHVHDSKAPVTKLRNAVPDGSRTFPVPRFDLAPEEDAVLFGLASRALRVKGWEIAIDALEALRKRAERPVYIALCGDGDEYDELVRLHGDRPGVRFLGYQSEVTAFYGLCDCCVLPTRFPGESFPFTLIESLKAGTPIIATDAGEIRSVVEGESAAAGIVIPWSDDDEVFTADVFEAMIAMLDDDRRAEWAENARAFANDYSFSALTAAYEEIYESVLR
jgi:glycosyltransferase involved in cell wall biosynthesis